MRLPSLPAAVLALVASPALASAESAPLPPPVQPVDVLVVVDSTDAMADERAALAATIDDFVTDLRDSVAGDYGTALSLHLGYVTADLGAGGHAYAGCTGAGDAGRLVTRAGCDAVDGNFLRAEIDQWGTETSNVTGDVGAAASCIAPVELDGCAFQQPLGAAVEALTTSDAANAGFLRPDAVLVVLVLTNQDDCTAPAAFFDPANLALGAASPLRCAQQSWTCVPAIDGSAQAHEACLAAAAGATSPITDLVGALEALKVDRSRIVVGALRGAPSPVAVVDGALAPSCGAGTERAATPGLRLDSFASAFAERSAVGLSCVDGYGAWLDEVGLRVREAIDGEEPDTYDPACDGGVFEPGEDAGETNGAEIGPTGCDAGAGGSGALLAVALLALAGFRPGRARRSV